MIYIILPAYNEADVIGSVVRSIREVAGDRVASYTAVLVDDGSTDETMAEAVRAASGGLELVVLRHGTNRGLGTALRSGIYWCLDHAGGDDVVVTLDADNTHPPALIPTLVDKLGQGFDVAIASRYRTGSEVRGVPFHRRLLSDVGRWIFTALYPIRGVRDYTCSFRAYRVALLRRARLIFGDDLCIDGGFEAVMSLLLRLATAGMTATEVALLLDYTARVGNSKMNVTRTIRRTIPLLIRRRIERIFLTQRRVDARLDAAARIPASPSDLAPPTAGRDGESAGL